jgi:hypothetical protein
MKLYKEDFNKIKDYGEIVVGHGVVRKEGKY